MLIIGNEKNTVKFLDKMTKRGVIDGPVFCEPKFFWFSDYEAEDYDPEDEDCTLDHRNLNNELDAEKFRNFIATSVDKRYRPIKSVLVLTENWEYDGKLEYS